MPSEVVVAVKNLSKTYRLGFFMNRKVHALSNLSLNIHKGEVFGLLGPNGAGKSTTIKILMNLVQPTSGEAHIAGHRFDSKEARRMVGFVPENPAPYEYLTGREFVTYSGHLNGLWGADLKRRTNEVLDAVRLGKASDIQIRRYSKGMLQRVTLAQALVASPSLLILDEPTSGLDPIGRRQMRDLILAEKSKGTTILFCTHIISDAEALCDRLAVVVGGQLMKEGSVTELLGGQVPSVEVAIEGLGKESIDNLNLQLEWMQVGGGRLVVRCSDLHLQQLIAAVVAAGGKISRVQPVRFSLEDLFVSAVQESKHFGVGGVISDD